MPEQNPAATPTTENASSGDPTLGPEDVRYEIRLRLCGQREVLIHDEVSGKLSSALTPAALGVVSAAIENGVQLLVQNATTRLSELVRTRGENRATEQPPAGYSWGPPATDQPRVYPDRLPPPPAKA